VLPTLFGFLIAVMNMTQNGVDSVM